MKKNEIGNAEAIDRRLEDVLRNCGFENSQKNI